MSCRIGRIIIVNNEGTVVVGNVNNISTSSMSNDNEGSGEGVTEESSVDNAKLGQTTPIKPIKPTDPAATASKQKNRNSRKL